MKHVKRIWPFVLADNKLAEEYLKQQAAKGLLLEGIGNYGFFATYRCVEPQKREFCIDGFKGKKEEIERYVRLAKDAGWDYVTEQPGHIFFVNQEGTNPVPMQTDWREEYLQIRKGLWSQDLPLGIFLGVMIGLIITLFGGIGYEEGLPMDWRSLYGYAIFIFIFIGFIKALWFYVKSEIALRRDEPMKLGRMKQAKLWGYGRAITGVIWVPGVVCNGGIVLWEQMQTGINVHSFATAALITCTILFIVIGIRLTKTDELGRKVFKSDEESKRLLHLSIALLVGSFVFFTITSFSGI